jgi:ATP citrate (pro-S)-lyase
MALKEYRHKLFEHKAKIYVRRGGPNYQEGLRIMRNVGQSLGLPIFVFGPETHMTAVVGMALGAKQPDSEPDFTNPLVSPFKFSGGQALSVSNEKIGSETKKISYKIQIEPISQAINDIPVLFTKDTRAIVFGNQPRAIQGMLDFDYCCSRKTPSVSAIVYAFGGNQYQRFYWGNQELLIPVYKDLRSAVHRHTDSTVLINFASFRSAFEVSLNALELPQIRVIAIIAEGIPENWTREIIRIAHERSVLIIGPATVGGIKPGCFKIGNTGGMLDNIISSKLYRPGSVAYVSRSGGMSNELNNIISRTTDGVYEGVAIGGDRYPGSTFIDHLFRFQDDHNVKILLLLGEVGGVEEYEVCKALRSKRINKPLVAWCIGTCGEMFNNEVQFGHAGSFANAQRETASFKNKALLDAGAIVPRNFDDLGDALHAVYLELVQRKIIIPEPEPEIPNVPLDYAWAKELGLVRKPANIVSTISDERGEELTYNGMPISKILEEGMGIGGVIGLLWFKKRLPDYACRFIETCLVSVADHGPAVAGAHNTIVTTRAGKDLISSLISGLLTVGDRFGGALDGAAKQFSEAFDKGLSPAEFVSSMQKQRRLIMGVGHAVKSKDNPDRRVELIKQFARNNFPKTPLLDYAEEVEKITTSKKILSNLKRGWLHCMLLRRFT